MGGLACGDGLAGLGQRSALRHQTRPRRELGRAACADVGVEPAARQAVDRRHGAGRARAELSAARARRTACIAAARASRVLARRSMSAGRTVKAPGPPFGLTITAGPSREAARPPIAGPLPLVRRARARFQLGDRRPDDDALSRRDGRRSHQGRGARPRRSRAAHRNCTRCSARRKQGIVLDLKKPEAVDVARALAAKSRRAGREFRDRRHGPAGPRRRGAARASIRI